MKLHIFLTAAIFAGTSLVSLAQTHKEGEEYYKADKLDNAKELLLRNYNNPGTDKSVSDYYLGLIALEDGNVAEASDYFNKGKQANPENPYNYVGLGQIALMNKNKGEAENLFKEAKKYAKKDASLDIAIARAYYNVDPVAYAKEIDKNFIQAQKDSPKDPNQKTAFTNEDIYLFDGDRYKDQKDFGKAAAQYQMASTYNPNATEAYVKYANMFTMVNPAYAIDELKKLLEVNPNSALGQREIAIAYYNNNDYKNAAKEYGKYVNNPNHFKQDEDRYAFLLFYGGDYQDGYNYASKLLAQNPDNFTARRYQFINASQLESMKDQLLPLAEALLAAHKKDPQKNKFAMIDYNLIGGELSDAGRNPEAQALFEEAIAEDPTNREYYKQLALVFVKGNNLPKASDAFEGYIANSENPGYNDLIQQATYAFYAGVQNQQENPDQAAKYYDKALESTGKAKAISPDYPKPFKIEGDIAKQRATQDQVASVAVPYYTEAIKLIEASDNPSRYSSDAKEMYNYMGNYYLDKKDVPTALIYFNKYLELDPDNEAYRKFVQGLSK